MRWENSLTIVLVLTAATARGQASRESATVKALEKVESSKADSIPPEVRAAIINKPAIAEATAKRAIGLREANNPHIQRGDGLLLPDMQDNPALSKVDLEKLHAERVALVERHGTHTAPVTFTSVGQAAAHTAGPLVITEGPPGKTRGYFELLFAGASLVLTVAGAAYFWKTQRR